VVTLVSKASGVSPILGYLVAGAVLGPHGLDVFSNERADVELGDFGILFLLFSEGLEVSSQRLAKLKNYLPLGFAQISLTTGVITAALLLGAPQFFDRFLPLDEGFIDISNPTEAVVLALAGTLSTSAFIFPVLKERGWEGEDSGQAATSILLLQDLFVAPLLVILPFVVGQGPTDYAAIAFLTAKAALGFGLVMFVGSKVLQTIFGVVAKTQSSETFVALSLLVSVGMGVIAKSLGLTDTAGAFAAGVLLANTNFRAQIQADILPFKGILLGIFFMDAGSLFDSELVLSELPTVLTGACSLIFLKAITVAAATRVPKWMEPNRLDPYDAVKLAFLLSGGGEFAFVVLALAEKFEVLPKDLGGLLTAIVLITMAVTPLLGIAAAAVSEKYAFDRISHRSIEDSGESFVSEDAIVVCGYGEIGKAVVDKLSDLDSGHLPGVVAFDTAPILTNSILMPSPSSAVMFGDSSNPEVLIAHGVLKPRAIFVSYDE
jgi:Kef-type K+ transport system membrane component KefB